MRVYYIFLAYLFMSCAYFLIFLYILHKTCEFFIYIWHIFIGCAYFLIFFCTFLHKICEFIIYLAYLFMNCAYFMVFCTFWHEICEFIIYVWHICSCAVRISWYFCTSLHTICEFIIYFWHIYSWAVRVSCYSWAELACTFDGSHSSPATTKKMQICQGTTAEFLAYLCVLLLPNFHAVRVYQYFAHFYIKSASLLYIFGIFIRELCVFLDIFAHFYIEYANLLHILAYLCMSCAYFLIFLHIFTQNMRIYYTAPPDIRKTQL